MGSTTPRQLTGARRRALAVLAHGHHHMQTVRVSNRTTPGDQLDDITDGVTLTVYWQTAEWFVARGHARVRGDVIYLTDTGRQLVDEAHR